MALLNWPPSPGTFPPWPPPEFEGGFSASDWQSAILAFRDAGFIHAAPTVLERIKFFRDARDGDGTSLLGRMLVSSDGTRRYPFAVSVNTDSRELLVLWPPFTAGWRSGPVSF